MTNKEIIKFLDTLDDICTKFNIDNNRDFNVKINKDRIYMDRSYYFTATYAIPKYNDFTMIQSFLDKGGVISFNSTKFREEYKNVLATYVKDVIIEGNKISIRYKDKVACNAKLKEFDKEDLKIRKKKEDLLDDILCDIEYSYLSLSSSVNINDDEVKKCFSNIGQMTAEYDVSYELYKRHSSDLSNSAFYINGDTIDIVKTKKLLIDLPVSWMIDMKKHETGKFKVYDSSDNKGTDYVIFETNSDVIDQYQIFKILKR